MGGITPRAECNYKTIIFFPCGLSGRLWRRRFFFFFFNTLVWAAKSRDDDVSEYNTLPGQAFCWHFSFLLKPLCQELERINEGNGVWENPKQISFKEPGCSKRAQECRTIVGNVLRFVKGQLCFPILKAKSHVDTLLLRWSNLDWFQENNKRKDHRISSLTTSDGRLRHAIHIESFSTSFPILFSLTRHPYP